MKSMALAKTEQVSWREDPDQSIYELCKKVKGLSKTVLDQLSDAPAQERSWETESEGISKPGRKPPEQAFLKLIRYAELMDISMELNETLRVSQNPISNMEDMVSLDKTGVSMNEKQALYKVFAKLVQLKKLRETLIQINASIQKDISILKNPTPAFQHRIL